MSDGFISVPLRRGNSYHANASPGQPSSFVHRGSYHAGPHAGSLAVAGTAAAATVSQSLDAGPAFSNPFSYLQDMSSSNASDSDDLAASLTKHSGTPEQGGSDAAHAHGHDDGEDFESAETLSKAEAARQSRVANELGRGPHVLAHRWSFWYLKPPVGSRSNITNYESLLKHIGTFSTVAEFWAIYLGLKRPNVLHDGTTDYSLFHSEIRPVWEDPANKNGGKLLLRIKKGSIISARYWETLILSLIGGEFHNLRLGSEICGLVFSIRPYEDIISIWTRSSQDTSTIQALREALKRIFDLPRGVLLEYKPHHFAKESHLTAGSRPESLSSSLQD